MKMKRTATDRPQPGKVYSLTGARGTACIANGASWAESECLQELPAATHNPTPAPRLCSPESRAQEANRALEEIERMVHIDHAEIKRLTHIIAAMLCYDVTAARLVAADLLEDVNDHAQAAALRLLATGEEAL